MDENMGVNEEVERAADETGENMSLSELDGARIIAEEEKSESGARVIWRPQGAGRLFQSRGEYEALYGGAAGGGKSDAFAAERSSSPSPTTGAFI